MKKYQVAIIDSAGVDRLTQDHDTLDGAYTLLHDIGQNMVHCTSVKDGDRFRLELRMLVVLAELDIKSTGWPE